MSATPAPKIPENPQVFTLPDTGISAPQLRAIEMLLSGMPVTQIAQKMGIDRKTLYEWRKNPVFQAEYNRRRMEASDAMDQRLRRLSDKAVDIVEKHLSEGSLQAATALLKLVAAMPRPALEADPHKILKGMIEQDFLDFCYEMPFERERLGKIDYKKGSAYDTCSPIYEYLARKHGIYMDTAMEGHIAGMSEAKAKKVR